MRNRLIARTVGGALALGAGLFLLAPAATAATAQIAAPATADVASAHQAATTPAVVNTLTGFFAHLTHSTAKATVTPKLVGPTVPVYYLNPKFVTSTSAPVAALAFMATEAVGPGNAHASVWTVRHGNTWAEMNIASGSEETDYAAKAATLGSGAIAFEEPQVHAWYALRDGRVVPLNSDATTSVGASGVSLADYQKLVNSRYADKLPGSAYQRDHMIGGINRGPLQQAGAGAAGGPMTALLGTLIGLVVVGGVGTVLVHRHRSSTR